MMSRTALARLRSVHFYSAGTIENFLPIAPPRLSLARNLMALRSEFIHRMTLQSNRWSPSSSAYCVRCDVLVGLGELRVIAVERRVDGVLIIDVESPPGRAGCPGYGQVAATRGRKTLTLVDAPMDMAPMRELLPRARSCRRARW